MDITLRYSTIDHFRETRKFKSLVGAQRYARRRMGNQFDIGSSYVVAGDGVSKLEAKGVDLCTLMGTTRFADGY